mmetsp:Transcript_132151/g.329581  ORF Transcript_132151/g.329581 Transcript_132151/m.329581 type:complete len:81 (+) Transcript_132151:243-485(+)
MRETLWKTTVLKLCHFPEIPAVTLPQWCLCCLCSQLSTGCSCDGQAMDCRQHGHLSTSDSAPVCPHLQSVDVLTTLVWNT